MGTKSAILCILACACLVVVVTGETPEQKAHALLQKMTLDEKLTMVHGWSGPYVGNVIANSRLGIPPLHLEDGPQGVADGVQNVTCWPSALTIIATWNTTTMYRYAKSLAVEQRMKGTNIMLGPMVNIARVPMGGRNFESFGEDPHLSSQMVSASIKGVQSEPVIATVKHWVDNNQEYNRTLTSANVDERTEWEIYYPAFQAAVDAGVGAVMCSYNRVNDVYACENDQTLTADLKQRMGFEGFVMSDWGATHSTIQAANNGLDMQMPDDSYFGNALKQAILNGAVAQSRLDDMVVRVLVPMFSVGLFDFPPSGNLSVDTQSKAHTLLAREFAAEATVLVKNSNNVLPLSSGIKKIAVLGDDGSLAPIVAGDGSGHVIPPYIVTPLQGIVSRAPGAQVSYAGTASLSKAVADAKAADVAIVFVGVLSSEGIDRANLSLGAAQDKLVSAVAAVQRKTIVVVHSPGSVLMPWANHVAAILCAFMPGQEDGNAIASVLFGDVNPSGKLPVTFPVTQDDIPLQTVEQYPGVDNNAEYSEQLLVGYRWYDAKKVAPLFPFGHGLSYTMFTFNNLHISGSISSGVSVSITITNSGGVDGAEVVQLYLGYPSSAGEPPKQLRGFEKVFLGSGDSSAVSFKLTEKDVSIWDVNTHDWSVIKGTFTVYVGASSRDIRATGTFTV